MSLRRVRVPEGLHRTRSVLTNCRPEDDSLPAVVPAERVGGRTRDALRAQGVTVRKEWAVRTGDEITSGDEGATRLLDGADPRRRPTGIFCYNDRVAAGVLHATTRLGIAVPGELSVVGYDDQEHMAASLTPALTTVALPHRAMGEAAARLLLDAIDTGRTPPATVRRFARPVGSRASVRPAPTPDLGVPVDHQLGDVVRAAIDPFGHRRPVRDEEFEQRAVHEAPDTESRTGRDAHGDGSRSLGARARPAVAVQDDGARRRVQPDRQRPVRRPQQGDAVRPCAVTVRSYDTGSGTGPGVVVNGSGARGSSSSGAGVTRSEPSAWTSTTRGAVSVPAQLAATTSAASRASHDQPHIRARPALFAAGGTAVFRNTVIREFTV